MKTISIYDEEANVIERIGDDHGVTDAEIIEALLVALNENGIDISDYL